MDLSVEIAGIRLKNPVIAASGTFGYGLEFAHLLDLNALGGFVVKGLSREPMAGNPAPRIVETAQPDHVPRVIRLGRVARSRLLYADGEEALLHQAAQNLDGRDGAKAFGTAGVRPRRENRRRGAAHLVL